jgi:hypothetical protein
MAITERLTYAELDYLLATHPAWSTRRADLAFPDTGDGHATTTAGLASLIVRGFAEVDGDGVKVAELVLAMSNALADAESFVFLSRADDNELSAGMISLDERPLLISLIAPGCVELVALDGTKSGEDLVATVVTALAGDGQILGVAAPGDSAILVGRLDDQWLLGGDPDKGDPGVVDELTVRAALGQIVKRARGALLSG